MIVTGAGLIFKVNCLEAEPALLAARTVNVNEPLAVGVPEIVPPDGLRLSPLGKPPLVMLHVIVAVPVAERFWLYDRPTLPSGKDEIVMVGAVAGAATIIVLVE